MKIILLPILIYLAISGGRLFYLMTYRELAPETIKSANLGSGKNIKYVVAGDSTTAGVGASTSEDAYPYQIATELSKNYSVAYRNVAVSGAKTQDLLDKQLPQIIAENPDLVTISIGPNDATHFLSNQKTIENFRKIISELNQKTHAKIYITNVATFKNTNIVLWPVPQLWERKSENLNQTINSLASGNAEIVDIHSVRADLSTDTFHPSSIGYKLWTAKFLEKIGSKPF